jgi:hypothetical protein
MAKPLKHIVGNADALALQGVIRTPIVNHFSSYNHDTCKNVLYLKSVPLKWTTVTMGVLLIVTFNLFLVERSDRGLGF